MPLWLFPQILVNSFITLKTQLLTNIITNVESAQANNHIIDIKFNNYTSFV